MPEPLFVHPKFPSDMLEKLDIPLNLAFEKPKQSQYRDPYAVNMGFLRCRPIPCNRGLLCKKNDIDMSSLDATSLMILWKQRIDTEL